MSEMKKILSGWKKYHSQIEEMSRSYTIDPKTVDSTRLHQFANTQANNKTDASLTQTVNDVLKAVQNNKNVFISFVDKYDENIPSLGVSPVISYETPHGVYGYPLDKHNVVQFLTTGLPTEADFATERDFFHLYTVNDLKKIRIEVDNKTNYNDSNYSRDLKNVIRMTIQYILPYEKVKKEDENQLSKRSTLKELEAKHFSTELDSSKEHYFGNDSSRLNIFKSEFIEFINDLINNNYISKLDYKFNNEDVFKRIDDEIISILAKNMHKLSNTSSNRFFKRTDISKFYNLYFCIRLCASIASKVSGSQAGEMFTILLKSADISAIDDDGTSLLHSSEPTQSVSMDTSRESGENASYNLIGTYKNYFADFVDLEFSSNYVAKEKQHIVKSLINRALADGSINIETAYPKTKKHDYNNIPIFKSLIDYIRKDFKETVIKESIFEVLSMLKEFVSDAGLFGDTNLESSQTKRIDAIFSKSEPFRKIKSSFLYLGIQNKTWYVDNKKEIDTKIFQEIETIFDKEALHLLKEFYKSLSKEDKELLNEIFETIKFNYLPSLMLENSLLKKYIQALLS
jgi:hypothetical protein